MTMSSHHRRRKCSGSVLHPGTAATPATRTGLLLLLIAISVTGADRYDQPPALGGIADASRFTGSNLLAFKDGIGNDVSTGSLWTSSILPAAATPVTVAKQQHHHRFGKPVAATAGKVSAAATKGSMKKQPAPETTFASQQVPELQVGCADGFIRADHHHRRSRSGLEKKRERNRSRSRRNKRDADPVEGERKRRDYPYPGYFSPLGYYQWTSKSIVQTPPQAAYSVWQPSLQQLTRPYFIPMWGSAGRSPVYFPPQPLNTPYPLDNPRNSYLPPMPYLPPYPPRVEPGDDGTTTTTTLKPIWEGDGEDEEVNIEDIEGGGTRYDGNEPVWDSSSGTSNSGNSINRIPTRRPKVPGITTPLPSILHGTSSNTGNSGGSSNGNGFNNNIPPLSNSIDNPLRPNQIGGNGRPNQIGGSSRPNNQQQPDNQFTRPRPTTQRTTTTTTTTTTRRPTTSKNDISVSKRPSRCVWAIVSCCTASSGQVNFGCFEELGCEGPFWDTNPCDSEVAKAAIANALKFYG